MLRRVNQSAGHGLDLSSRSPDGGAIISIFGVLGVPHDDLVGTVVMIVIKSQIHGVPEVQRMLQQAPTVVVKELNQGVTEGLEIVASLVRTKYLSGPYPRYLQPRTGGLRASWQRGHQQNIWSLTAKGLVIHGEVGSRIHRQIHETGGTITPKRSRYLRIPTQFIKTPAGVVRGPYQVADARSIPNTFIRKTRAGTLAIWQVQVSGRKGARSSIIPIFWLKPSVFIPARPVKEPAERDATPPITANIQGHIARAERTLEAMVA